MSWRVFAALELPPELKQQLARLQDGLGAKVPSRSVRWVRPEGVHLTLKFYGDVEADRLPPLQAGLGRAAVAVAPMLLAVGGVGVFPNASRPRVIWVGLGGQLASLQRLQATVEQDAIALGFKPEDREYNPHLTLGRVNYGVRPRDVRCLMEALEQAGEWQFGNIRPERLSLMNSELRAGGSVYTQLYSAPLAAEEQSA